MVDAVAYYLEQYCPPKTEVSTEQALAEYFQAKASDMTQNVIGKAQYKSIRSQVRVLSDRFADRSVSAITSDDITQLLTAAQVPQ